jgi:hypothetical protein
VENLSGVIDLIKWRITVANSGDPKYFSYKGQFWASEDYKNYVEGELAKAQAQNE